MAQVNIWVCVELPQFPSPPKKNVDVAEDIDTF